MYIAIYGKEAYRMEFMKNIDKSDIEKFEAGGHTIFIVYMADTDF
jgi:hypothetical protein